MTKLLGTIIVHLLSIGSIIRFYFSLPDGYQNQLQWELVAISMCLFNVAAIVWESISHVRSAPTRFKLAQQDRIKRYMIVG